jgi:GH24 family phage-related lysozyme (muramidase)
LVILIDLAVDFWVVRHHSAIQTQIVADIVSPAIGDSSSFEQEKSESERAFRERELRIKERAQENADTELQMKRTEQAASRWKNPLVVAILAAAIAGVGNAWVAYFNGTSQTALEKLKSEQARILEMIKTGNADKAAENLQFLLDAGLILDPAIGARLREFLRTRQPGTGPALPSSLPLANVSELLSKFEGTTLMPTKDFDGVTTIGSGHVLTDEELKTGKLIIGDESVDYRSGITQEQARKLLDQDLTPIRHEIDKLVKVPLNVNQREALASFVFNVGVHHFERSELLKKLNAGQYNEVPSELLKEVTFGGRTYPGLVKRRQSEAELWQKQ